MIKKYILAGILILVIVALLFYWKNLNGIWTAIRPATSRESVSPAPNASGSPFVTNTTGIPLNLPEGFSISTFVENIPGARVIKFDQQGNMWVSQTSQGIVSRFEIKNGDITKKESIFRGLNNPHGIVFDPDDSNVIYIAEEHRISKATINPAGQLNKIADLPNGGGHFTRTLGFGPDKRLYVSIGSSCNVCNESDNRRAKIFVMNKDGSDFKEYARGLRNAVFFVWSPDTKEMWATEMGRDNLGDNIPPDEINIIKEGKNYGWPICYGKNIHDTNFDKNTYIRNPCQEPTESQSLVDLQAHSAPLGLSFITNNKWPSDFEDDLIVAFHGSWNRSTPTGYKLVRLKFEGSRYLGQEDFISGWLTGSRTYGRPVDVVNGPDGNLYVSDDRAGLIYRISYP